MPGVKYDSETHPIRWAWDFLRKPFAPRRERLNPPLVGIFEAPYVCFRVNKEWLSHVTGMLQGLLELDAWEGTDETQYAAIQQIEQLFASMEQDCGEGGMNVTSWRFTDDCIMQYSNDNGVTWQNVPGWPENAMECFKGDKGDKGDKGNTGAPGMDGECPDCGNPGTRPAPEDTMTDDTNSLCAACVETLRWLIQIENNYCDQIDLYVTVASELINILSLGMYEAAKVVPLVGALVSLVEFAFDVTTAVIRLAINDPDNQDKMFCLLYCIVKRDSGLTKAGYDEWFGQLLSEFVNPDLEGTKAIRYLLESMAGTDASDIAYDSGYAAFSSRFALEALNSDGRCEELCDDCPEEQCPEIDIVWTGIAATPSGWSDIPEITSTVGWLGDTTAIVTQGTNYSCSRVPNGNWTNSRAPSGGIIPKIGVKYVFPEPCDIFNAGMSYQVGNSNSKRVIIVIKRDDDVMEVIKNFVDTLPAPTLIITGVDALRTVKEIWFLGMHGGTGIPENIVRTYWNLT